ncbi:hypothetical protein BC349_09120 [Flavihumibacter stibioxidans]|uniref:Uncharacterized protein n=2 Tax=Flavihumibacter stibioxidans TaxID=1834163 RepID=A0ABR7M839_9BACT|nr:hypothetical protein [Flavihumibacter stibioxidans]
MVYQVSFNHYNLSCMKKILVIAAAGGLILAGCSKDRPVGPSSPEVITKSLRIHVFAENVRREGEPVFTEAGLKLVVMKTNLRDAVPMLVWDTMIQVKSLARYPGSKEPMLIRKSFELDRSGEFLHLMYHKIYRINQLTVIKDFTESFPAGQFSKQLDIPL